MRKVSLKCDKALVWMGTLRRVATIAWVTVVPTIRALLLTLLRTVWLILARVFHDDFHRCIIVVSLFFALLHFTFVREFGYLSLTFIASLIYGSIYQATRSIESSNFLPLLIQCHALLLLYLSSAQMNLSPTNLRLPVQDKKLWFDKTTVGKTWG